MYDTIFELDNQLKLKQAIIVNFIPPEEVKKIEGLSHWDAELNDWQIKPPKNLKFQKKKGAVRPVSAVGMKRPTSEYSRIAKGLGDMNPRYKFENILDLDLDMPERTTEDIIPEMPSQRVQNAINMILNSPEEDFAKVDISQIINFDDPMLGAEEKKKAADRPKSAK